MTASVPKTVLALLVAVPLLLLSAAPGPCAVDLQTLEVVGSSTVSQENVARARELAIADSLVSALEQAAATLLPVESLIQNFGTLNNLLFGRTEVFVQNFTVLTEARAGDMYRVLVRVTVSTQRIREHLSAAGIMAGKKAMPRILFFITERAPGQPPSKECYGQAPTGLLPAAAASLVRVMREQGFTILSAGSVAQKIDGAALTCDPDFDNSQAARVGELLQADVVVVGKSVADVAPNTMGGQIRSFSGSVNIRAIRTDTAESLATAAETVVVTHNDPVAGAKAALADAGARAAKALSQKLLTAWKAEKEPQRVALLITGTRNLGHFVKFRRELSRIEGVKELQSREMKADEAVLAVEYEGSAKELADALLRIPFEAFAINITEVSPGQLRVELLSPDQAPRTSGPGSSPPKP